MIQYDPHQWLATFFNVRGSLVKETFFRVASCAVWAAGVVAVHKFVQPVGTSLALHTLLGVAIGMLLVFRTSSSYERYWEGRKLWGGIVNSSRNLIRGAVIHFEKDPELVRRLARWTTQFSWATMKELRGIDGLGPRTEELPEESVRRVIDAQHMPLAVTVEMSQCLMEAKSKGLITDIVYTSLDRDIQSLIDCLGGCERIRKTPMPFAYAIHLRRALVLYCFTLPFALVEIYGWTTVLDVTLLSYIFFGIEEIGVEIEGPFGTDVNDLPLEDICETIQKNLIDLAGIEHMPRETLPKGG